MEIVVRIDAEDALEGTEVGRAERGGDRDGGSVCDCDTRGGYALDGTEVGMAEGGGARGGGSVCDCDTRGGYAWVLWRGGGVGQERH